MYDSIDIYICLCDMIQICSMSACQVGPDGESLISGLNTHSATMFVWGRKHSVPETVAGEIIIGAAQCVLRAGIFCKIIPRVPLLRLH